MTGPRRTAAPGCRCGAPGWPRRWRRGSRPSRRPAGPTARSRRSRARVPGASSTASASARNATAPLVVAITDRPGAGRQAATPENSRNDPRTSGARCLASSSGPTTFASNAVWTASRSSSPTGPFAGAAASDTTWSSGPEAAANAAMPASSVRSILAVAAPIRAATGASRSGSRPARVTLAPSATASAAIARAMPEPPPTISRSCPASVVMSMPRTAPPGRRTVPSRDRWFRPVR